MKWILGPVSFLESHIGTAADFKDLDLGHHNVVSDPSRPNPYAFVARAGRRTEDELCAAALTSMFPLIPKFKDLNFVILGGQPGPWAQYFLEQNDLVLGYATPGFWNVDDFNLPPDRFFICDMLRDPAVIWTADPNLRNAAEFNLLAMISWIENKVATNVDLVLGLEAQKDMSLDQLHACLRAQIIVALRTLRVGMRMVPDTVYSPELETTIDVPKAEPLRGGNLILRVYSSHRHDIAHLLYATSRAFERVTLVKPLPSNPYDDELYFVCLGFLDPVATFPTLEFMGYAEPREQYEVDEIQNLTLRPTQQFVSWLQQAHTDLAAFRKLAAEFDVLTLDLMRLYRMWNLAIVDSRIMKQRFDDGRQRPFVLPTAGIVPYWMGNSFGFDFADPEIIDSLMSTYGWDTRRPRPLPISKVMRFRLTNLVAVIVSYLKKHRVDFPWLSLYGEAPHVLYAQLENYDPPLTPNAKYTLDVKAPFSSAFALPGRTPQYYYVTSTGFTEKRLSVLPDWFAEPIRLQASVHSIDNTKSPLDLWNLYGAYVIKGVETTLQNELVLSPETLARGLRITGSRFECMSEDVTFIRSLLLFLRAQSVLDGAPGWGVHLLAAQSLKIPYRGYQPLIDLHPIYQAMGGTLGFEVDIQSGHVPNDGLATYDVCLYVPPIPVLEHYTTNDVILDKDSWVSERLQPTLDALWTHVAVGGFLVIATPHIVEAGAHLWRLGAFLCGPITIHTAHISRPYWVWTKLKTKVRLTNDQSMAHASAKLWARSQPQHGVSAGVPGDVRLSGEIDDFPYAKYIIDPYPQMFARLRAGVAHMPERTLSYQKVERHWTDPYATDLISCHFTEPQRMRCAKAGKISPRVHWDNLSLDERRRILGAGPEAAYNYISDSGLVCSVFNPHLCLTVILDTVGRGARILDPSSGWGDRLISALASEASVYHGVDPNMLLQPSYRDIVANLGPLVYPNVTLDELHQRFNVTPVFFESFVSNQEYDLAITSPPYYDLEEYEGAQRYDSYDDWLHRMYYPYLRGMYGAVRDGGWIALYVENIVIRNQNVDLSTDTFNFITGLGGIPHPEYIIYKHVTTVGDLRKIKSQVYCWQKPSSSSSSSDSPSKSMASPLRFDALIQTPTIKDYKHELIRMLNVLFDSTSITRHIINSMSDLYERGLGDEQVHGITDQLEKLFQTLVPRSGPRTISYWSTVSSHLPATTDKILVLAFGSSTDIIPLIREKYPRSELYVYDPTSWGDQSYHTIRSPHDVMRDKFQLCLILDTLHYLKPEVQTHFLKTIAAQSSEVIVYDYDADLSSPNYMLYLLFHNMMEQRSKNLRLGNHPMSEKNVSSILTSSMSRVKIIRNHGVSRDYVEVFSKS